MRRVGIEKKQKKKKARKQMAAAIFLFSTLRFVSLFFHLLLPSSGAQQRMSWITAAAVQLVITGMTLGALKKNGIIT